MHIGSNKIAMRVSWVSIAVNVVLSLFKVFAGIFARSSAMISDAVHSASDVFSTVIVMVGMHEADKKSDREHPYGHDRMECVASVILSAALFITGAAIGWDAASGIITKSYKHVSAPGALALAAAIISIGVKEWMFWYTRFAAKKIKSTALMADAWHHRSDAISSVGALIGIGLSMAGFPIFDPIASFIICILIIKVSVDIFKEACSKMVDTAADSETEKRLSDAVMSVDGVHELNLLTTRLFGSKMYVDIEFSADGALSLADAHAIAQRVHDKLEREFPDIKHCMIHVNPD